MSFEIIIQRVKERLNEVDSREELNDIRKKWKRFLGVFTKAMNNVPLAEKDLTDLASFEKWIDL